jgi:hypothetical protein
MGWIETYEDPENIRGTYEAWIAITDKDRSQKFKKLVDSS